MALEDIKKRSLDDTASHLGAKQDVRDLLAEVEWLQGELAAIREKTKDLIASAHTGLRAERDRYKALLHSVLAAAIEEGADERYGVCAEAKEALAEAVRPKERSAEIAECRECRDKKWYKCLVSGGECNPVEPV